MVCIFGQNLCILIFLYFLFVLVPMVLVSCLEDLKLFFFLNCFGFVFLFVCLFYQKWKWIILHGDLNYPCECPTVDRRETILPSA